MRIPFFMLLLLFSYSLFSQVNDFRKGTVVLQDGSELTGYLNLDGRQTISKRIRFRSSPNSTEEKTLTPRQIKEAHFLESGRLFRPITHTISSIETKEKRQTQRIAEVLIEGSYVLYVLDRFPDEYYKNKSKITDKTYYLSDGNAFHPLLVEERAVSGTEFNLVESFRGGLKYFFKDWPEAAQKIAKVRYTDADMKRLFREYFLFKGDVLEPITKNQSVATDRAKLGVRLLGSDFSRFLDSENTQFGGGAGIYWQNDNFVSANAFSVEIGFEFLTMKYDDSQPNQSIYEAVKIYRLPISGEFYFTRQGLVKPRAVLYGTLGILNASFRNGANNSRTNTSFGLGIGVDIKAFIADLRWESQTGFLLGVGYRYSLNKKG